MDFGPYMPPGFMLPPPKKKPKDKDKDKKKEKKRFRLTSKSATNLTLPSTSIPTDPIPPLPITKPQPPPLSTAKPTTTSIDLTSSPPSRKAELGNTKSNKLLGPFFPVGGIQNLSKPKSNPKLKKKSSYHEIQFQRPKLASRSTSSLAISTLSDPALTIKSISSKSSGTPIIRSTTPLSTNNSTTKSVSSSPRGSPSKTRYVRGGGGRGLVPITVYKPDSPDDLESDAAILKAARLKQFPQAHTSPSKTVSRPSAFPRSSSDSRIPSSINGISTPTSPTSSILSSIPSSPSRSFASKKKLKRRPTLSGVLATMGANGLGLDVGADRELAILSRSPSSTISEPAWNSARQSTQSTLSTSSIGGPKTPRHLDGEGPPVITVEQELGSGLRYQRMIVEEVTGQGHHGVEYGNGGGLLGDGPSHWIDMEKTPRPSSPNFETVTPTYPSRVPSSSNVDFPLLQALFPRSELIEEFESRFQFGPQSQLVACPDDSPTLLPAIEATASSPMDLSNRLPEYNVAESSSDTLASNLNLSPTLSRDTITPNNKVAKRDRPLELSPHNSDEIEILAMETTLASWVDVSSTNSSANDVADGFPIDRKDSVTSISSSLASTSSGSSSFKSSGSAPSIPSRGSSRPKPKPPSRGSSLRSSSTTERPTSPTPSSNSTVILDRVLSNSSSHSNSSISSTQAVSACRPSISDRLSRSTSVRSSIRPSLLSAIDERDVPRDLEVEPEGSWALRSRKSGRVKRARSQPLPRSTPCWCDYCDRERERERERQSRQTTTNKMPFSKQKAKQPEMDAMKSNLHSFIPASAFPPSQTQTKSQGVTTPRPGMMQHSYSYQGTSPSALPIPKSRNQSVSHGHRGLTQTKSFGELGPAKKDSLRSSINHAGNFLKPRGWSKARESLETDIGISSVSSIASRGVVDSSEGDERKLTARQLDRDQELARERFRQSEKNRQDQKEKDLVSFPSSCSGSEIFKRVRTKTDGSQPAPSLPPPTSALPSIPQVSGSLPTRTSASLGRNSVNKAKTSELEAILNSPNNESKWPARKLEFDSKRLPPPKNRDNSTSYVSVSETVSRSQVNMEEGISPKSQIFPAINQSVQQQFPGNQQNAVPMSYPGTTLPALPTLPISMADINPQTSLEILIQIQMQQQAQLMQLIQAQMAQQGITHHPALSSMQIQQPVMYGYGPPTTPLPPVPTTSLTSSRGSLPLPTPGPGPTPIKTTMEKRSASLTTTTATATPILSPISSDMHSTPSLPTPKAITTPSTILASSMNRSNSDSPSSISISSRIRPAKSAAQLDHLRSSRAPPPPPSIPLPLPLSPSGQVKFSPSSTRLARLNGDEISPSGGVTSSTSRYEGQYEEPSESEKRDTLLSLLNAENWEWPAPPNRSINTNTNSDTPKPNGTGTGMNGTGTSPSSTYSVTTTSPISCSSSNEFNVRNPKGLSMSNSISTISTDFGIITPPHTSRDLSNLAGSGSGTGNDFVNGEMKSRRESEIIPPSSFQRFVNVKDGIKVLEEKEEGEGEGGEIEGGRKRMGMIYH